MQHIFCSYRSPDNLRQNQLKGTPMQTMRESQIIIEFPEPVIFPGSFSSLREYAIYVQQQVAHSRTGTHTQRLSDAIIIEYISVLPSLILIREDGQDWPESCVLQWGMAFFGGRSFREIHLRTAGGYKSKRGLIEITPNFAGLQNFRVIL